MGRREKKDHYDRPSWSELDKRRGKKSSSGPPAPAGDRPPDRWKAKVAEEKFDALFTDPKKEEALQKIRDTLVKDAATFGAAVDEFKKDFGLPEDFDLLQRILENHPSGDVRTETLEKMDTLVDGRPDSTKQVFKTRVKLLALTAREPNLKKAASRIAKLRKY